MNRRTLSVVALALFVFLLAGCTTAAPLEDGIPALVAAIAQMNQPADLEVARQPAPDLSYRPAVAEGNGVEAIADRTALAAYQMGLADARVFRRAPSCWQIRHRADLAVWQAVSLHLENTSSHHLLQSLCESE